MCLMGILVRPSSTVSCTGMSRIMLMSLPAPVSCGVAALKLANDAGATCSTAVEADSAGLLSASAAAHSAAMRSSSDCAALLSGDILFSQPALLGAGQQLVDLEGVLAVAGAVVAVEHGHAVHLGLDVRVQVELDEVAGLEAEQLLHRGRRSGQLGHQLHLGGLDLLLEQVDP